MAALERGDVIVFPTETLYGLGADALNAAAVDQVFELKGRDRQNPMPVLIAGEEMLLTVARDIPPLAAKLMSLFWPGPLTIVVPGRGGLPEPLLNQQGGIGVRISSHPIATTLVQRLGRPLTATSANPSRQAPARTIAQAKRYFAGRIDVFIDGGALSSKTGSTVVQVAGNDVKVIREGEIDAETLRKALES